MITVKIIGGLGNQMFQYALGRHLAILSNTELQLDTTEFKTYPHHKYSLQHFNIIENYATETDVEKFRAYDKKLSTLSPLTLKLLKKFWLDKFYLAQHGYIKEDQPTYNPALVRSYRHDMYFEGYWQTEKYFKAIEDVIRKDFTLKTPMGDLGKHVEEEIKNTAVPVCLHIRRGDFANNPVQSKFHGVTPLEHYYEGIKIITAKYPNPHFFVFSDSIEWAKENLKINYPATFVGQGPEKNYEELVLMSKCKHHILSNSTFGWWGAWLGYNPDQMVIAPKRWFNKNVDLSDLMPESWIQLDI